jgi:hypothetical protein
LEAIGSEKTLAEIAAHYEVRRVSILSVESSTGKRLMRVIVFATAILAVLGGAAHAEGNGGPPTGYERWQAAMGNPTIPSTEWFAMTPDQRRTRVRKLQMAAEKGIWTDNSCGQIIKVTECMPAEDKPPHNEEGIAVRVRLDSTPKQHAQHL